MDNLPEQHIDSLTGTTRREAYEKLAFLCVARREGIGPEDEVARRVGFSSAEAMQHQLKLWGLSGLLPPEDDEQSRKINVHSSPQRKGRTGGGEAEKLPAAKGARDLFEYAIARLKADLDYTNSLVETLQDDRFEATLVYPKGEDPHPRVYLRDQVSDGLSAKRWEELCAEQGKDPASTDTLYVSQDRSRYLAGTSPRPAMPLVRLIAAYCICAKSTDDIAALLDRLHPKSREPNMKQVYKYLTGDEGLQPTSKKLAQVVRGKPVRRGLNAVGEDLFHHVAGDFIRTSRERGVPEEVILRELREEYELPEDEIVRLQGVFAPNLDD